MENDARVFSPLRVLGRLVFWGVKPQRPRAGGGGSNTGSYVTKYRYWGGLLTKWQGLHLLRSFLRPLRRLAEPGQQLVQDTLHADQLSGTRDRGVRMGHKGYTILILTDLTSRARQLRLSRRTLGGALLAATLALLMIFYLGYQYLSFRESRGELERLRQTVEAQRGLAARLESLTQEVTQLRTFDHQIRRLAGMEAGPEGESTMAVGGGRLELQKALTAWEQAAQQQLIERLSEDLQHLEREVALREESLGALTTYLTRQKDRLVATPTLWPTQGYMSSKFGPRTSPFTGRRQRHTGIDIAALRGTPIVAPADGVVTYTGKLPGYGRVIVLTHGFGFKTFYGHNQRNKVRKGKRVKRGQVIGTVGNTGHSTGSHLHYEVLVNETPVNPLKYIIDEGRRARVLRAK